MPQCIFQDETYCGDFGGATTHGYENCWVRIPDSATWNDALGCGIGCHPCLDLPHNVLQSAMMLDAIGDPTRFLESVDPDAVGYMHDLVQREPRLVNEGTRYTTGACWDVYRHRECPNAAYRTCECWPDPVTDADPNTMRCPNPDGSPGPLIGALVQGPYPTGIIYQNRWPPSIECWKFHDSGTKTVGANSMQGNTEIIRNSVYKVGCATDWLIPFAAWAIDGPACEAGFRRRYDAPEQSERYIDHESSIWQDLFEELRIWENEASFQTTNLLPEDRDQAIIRNAALDTIRSLQYIVDHAPDMHWPKHQVQDGGNAGLGWFTIRWNGFNWDIGALPLIYTMPYARTRFGEYPVQAEVVLRSADTIASLALPHYWRGGNDYVEAHVVWEFRFSLGMRVELPANCPYDLSYGKHWPRITPNGNEIMYAIEPGRWFRPPAHGEWRGVLNSFTDEPWTLAQQGFPRIVTTDSQILSQYDRVAPMLKDALNRHAHPSISRIVVPAATPGCEGYVRFGVRQTP